MPYVSLFIFLVFSLILSIVILAVSYIITYKRSDTEKVSAYECGFDPFEDARVTFDIRFYLVSILFIVFDLEVSFLFPWVVVLKHLSFLGVLFMYLFLIILTVGFVYEWRKGGLEWH